MECWTAKGSSKGHIDFAILVSCGFKLMIIAPSSFVKLKPVRTANFVLLTIESEPRMYLRFGNTKLVRLAFD